MGGTLNVGVAGLRVDEEKDMAWWGEGNGAEGDVPVVWDGARGGKLVAVEGVEG